jgi:hypothetical protein
MFYQAKKTQTQGLVCCLEVHKRFIDLFLNFSYNTLNPFNLYNKKAKASTFDMRKAFAYYTNNFKLFT